MRHMGAAWVMLLLSAAGEVGCASPPTSVRVNAPAGSTMAVGGKRYGLPATVALERPRKAGEGRRAEVGFTFPVQGGTITAAGIIEAFGWEERDVDRLAANTCDIGVEELTRLVEGYALIFDGYSASQQRIFKMTIGMKK